MSLPGLLRSIINKIIESNLKKKKKNKIEKVIDNTLSLPEFWFRNVIGMIISIIFITILYFNVGGYKWLWDSLVVNNVKIMHKNPKMTLPQKWSVKCGFDYQYLDYLKNNTPEDAIILMPAKDKIYPKGQKSDFNTKSSAGIKNKAWAVYFLYPRKLVYENEIDNPYYDSINYVAIVNFLGYENLDYAVGKKKKYTILPVHQM